MRVGVPRGFFYYAYRPFLEAFFSETGVQPRVCRPTDQEILRRGMETCVDEACLPAKVLCGQVDVLADSCDQILLPRIMKTEFGESICPKVAGAADLIQKKKAREKLIFTQPLYLDQREQLKRTLWRECKKIGIRRSDFKAGFMKGIEAQRRTWAGLDEDGYPYQVFLAGHAYNLYDPFINMDLIKKLHRLGIGVVTEERVSRGQKERKLQYADLMKKPYWSFFVNSFGSLEVLKRRGIHGVIYVSSFSCGTDSFTVEMMKNNVGSLPMLVLKLDEQRGEAGFDTRLEAFCDVLKGRGR